MCLFCFMYEQCLFRTFSQGFFLIYSIRLCFLSFLGKHPLHHMICLQRSHFYLLAWTLASFMHILRIQLWQCNSMFCHFCFINVLQFLSASTPPASNLQSCTSINFPIPFYSKQLQTCTNHWICVDSSSGREDFHCFSFKVWRIFLTFIRSHTSDHEQK